MENRGEFLDVASEYTPASCEYNQLSDEFQQNKTKFLNKTKKKSKLRKISYLVAACLATVVIGRTLNEASLKEINLAGYENWGYAKGNVIPVQKDGLWGLMDYDGNVLLEPTYSGFFSSPNDHGYTVFTGDAGFYVYDARGRLALEFSGQTYSVLVGEDDVVLVKQQNATSFRYMYMKIDGDVIYDTGWRNGDTYFNVAGPFHEGKAYLYLDEDSTMDATLYEVTLKGARKIESGTSGVDENGNPFINPTYAPIGALAQGYYLAEVPGGGGGWYLFYPETRTVTSRLVDINEESLLKSAAIEEMIESLKSYKVNGVEVFNYYTYGVASIAGVYVAGSVKDVLFDYRSITEDEELREAIAIYDEIVLDNFKYLSVSEEDTSFYIDYSGNVVSDIYDATTSFNDRGYAMVQEGKAAYVINDKFEKLETIENVTGVGYNDDTFIVQYEDDGISLYYY